MKIDNPNKNLKSLLQHATMVNRSKYGVCWNDYRKYSVSNTINSKWTIYIYKPNISFSSRVFSKNITIPSISIYNVKLLINIKSLTNHYIKYFNLPKPDKFIISSGNVFRCVHTSNDEYTTDCMFWLSRYYNYSHLYATHSL